MIANEWPDMIRSKWYFVVNDLIGGHAISPVDRPTSEYPYTVADLINDEDTAAHIVWLHNEWLERGGPGD